jgi:hypothetical protein
MQVSVVDEFKSSDPNKGLHVRDGGANRDFRVLLQDDAPDGFNFWAGRTVQNDEGDDAFVSPRHKHTFQQIKFCEKGALDVTPGQYIHEGDLGFFPKGAYYGPQSREKGLTSIVCQYGFNGEHQRGEYWDSRRAEVLERLKARGRIEKGIFIERDPVTGETKTRDSVDALYDERYQLLKGVPLKIPEPIYDAPILIHPGNSRYYQAAPGVEMKQLGRFFDQPGPNGDVSISVVRLSGGALDLRADRPQIAWTLGAGLKAGDRVCPGAAAIYSPRGEQGQISGDNGLEVFVVEFPRLD